MRFLSTTLLLAICTNCFAQDPIVLPKGTPAPFSGYLIDQDTADKAQKDKNDLDATTRINSLLVQDNQYYKERLQNYKDDSAALSKELVEQRDNSLLSKIGFFVLGAVTTTVVAYGVSRSLR